MKKHNKKLLADNGVTVSCKVFSNEKVYMPLLNDILLILLSILTAISSVMTMSTILKLKISSVPVILFTALFCILYGIAFKLVKKRKYLVFIFALLTVGIVVLIFNQSIFKGAVILFEQAKETISKCMAWDDVVHTYNWEDSFYSVTDFTVLSFSFLLCSAVSYFTVVKPSFIAVFLLTFPFFLVGSAFGAVPTKLYFSMMVAAWTASLTVSRAADAKIKTKHPNGKRTKSSAENKKSRFAGSAAVIALITICLFFSSTTILNYIGFSRSENIDTLRSNTKEAISDAYDYITGNDNDGSLKEGNLLEVDDRRVKNRHYFSVETNIESTEYDLILKGYTAPVYKNNRWEQSGSVISPTLSDKTKNGGFTLAGVKGSAIESYENAFFEAPHAELRLYDFRRKKDYIYDAYYGSYDDKFSTISKFTSTNDCYISATDNSDYTYMMFFPTVKTHNLLSKSKYFNNDEFLKFWKEYNSFVEKEYTSSFATQKVKELGAAFKSENKYEIVDNVRQYLKDNIKYTNIVNKSPADKDFVENLLFETKCGYSTHFATAAAVLLQSQGIPARYIEGYYIPRDVINSSPKNHADFLMIDVTDAYAHAWIEIYDSSLGWMPVEVTPGYWAGSFAEQMKKNTAEMQETPEPETENSENNAPEPDTGADFNQSVQPPDEGTDITKYDKRIFKDFKPSELIKLLLLGMLCIIILILSVILALHFITVNLRKKKINSNVPSDSIFEAYKYFKKLANYEGISCDNIHSYAEFITMCSDKSKNIVSQELEKFMVIAVQSAFSDKEPTLEQAKYCKEFTCSYSRKIFSCLPWRKKIMFAFVHNLY